jgi:topoisomerase-4 subunit B
MNDLFDIIEDDKKASQPIQKPSKNINTKKPSIKNNSYTAENITILEGLEPVRKRPGMYIGGVDSKALHHLFNEVIDNCVDEVVAGFADAIDVVLDHDNIITISDNGRGIPIDPHPKQPNKSALEIIMTTLHAGGKFDNESYKTSGGLHGVGISVVNALSEHLKVQVVRDKNLYIQEYELGKPVTKLEKKGATKANDGTSITFKPDYTIFDPTINFEASEIIEIIKTKAYLVGGLKINWQNNTEPDPELQSLSFYYPNGINDFVNEELDKKNLLIPNTFFGSSITKSKDGKVEWSLLWSAGDKNNLKSFCNTIPTIYGGTHETAFKSAILKSIKNYAEIIGIRNSKIITLDDIVSCMDGVLSIFINEPEFQGQTKEKLSSKNATTITSSIIADNFDHWLSENSSEAEKLINFFISTANSRISKKHEKDLNRKSALRKLRLPGKLADCLEEKAEGTELFIVEGDSAGGSAKQARDKKYQAVLPLRGKILNVANSSAQKYYQNQQLKDLVQALGCGTSDNYTDENLRYEKVIIMTDADVDGAHIAALLITFFFKEMPQLIVNNHLFLAVPPLYKITGGNNILYAIDDNDREMIIEKKFKKSKVEISRFKGLGEMLPNQLRDTTMKKETRKLVQVSINNSPIEYYELIIDQLMGSKADARFKFIQENANFYANT